MKWKEFRHMLAHWFNLNTGQTVTKEDDDGFIWVAFECKTCGKIQGKMRIDHHIFRRRW